MSSDWNNRLTYHCFPIFWSSTFFGSSSPTLPAGFLTYRSTLCQTFSHGSPTQWLPSKISGIWHHSLLTVTGSLRTLTWFPIILATTIALRHWKTLSKPSITKNPKMSSSCPKIHLTDGKKVVRGIHWSTYRLLPKHRTGTAPGGTDSLLLVLLAKMRSGTYVDFREGPPTLVNIVEVGD